MFLSALFALVKVEEVDETEMARRVSDPVWIVRMEYVRSALAFPTD